MYAMSGKNITFIKRMGKSWSVADPSLSIKYKNNRGLHVETDLEGLAGKVFTLGARHTRVKGDNVAVMYDVLGVTSGRHVAHLTVYFGPLAEANEY